MECLMNKSRIAFWILTGLFCLGIAPGAVLDIAQPDMVVEIVQTLELPLHLLTLIGIWKLLGIVALLRPQWRRLNEWAYAGFVFDLTGAAFLHGAVGGGRGGRHFTNISSLFFLF